MIAGMAVMRGEIAPSDVPAFVRDHGMPGFSPTQGHVASTVPYLGHALDGMRDGSFRNTLFLAKGSLFLGRMTQMADGLSFLLEKNDGTRAWRQTDHRDRRARRRAGGGDRRLRPRGRGRRLDAADPLLRLNVGRSG
jgi:betaine reductase